MADDAYQLMQQLQQQNKLQRQKYGSIEPYTNPKMKRVKNIADMLQAFGLARTPRDAFRMANKMNTARDTVGEFLPGTSYELAKERNDKLGQGLSMIDLIPAGGLLTAPVKAAKKAKGIGLLDEGSKVSKADEIAARRAEANEARWGPNWADEVDTSYRGQHQVTEPELGAARLDDMTGGGTVFPDDIYSPQGLRYYGNPNNKFDRESYEVIQKARNNPDMEITIYRAVPKGVKDINPGDFVTPSKTYAKDHAYSGYGPMGDEAGNVISKKVKVKEIYSPGDDLNEFGYFPIKD